MFSKLSALAVLVPFVARSAALTLSTPTNLSSGGEATITWTTASGDPSTFSLELVNTAFHNSFAIANNVQPSLGTITLELPVVPPGDGYTLEAVNIANVNEAYATSGGFAIADTVSSTTTSGSTTSGLSTTVTTLPSSTSPASSTLSSSSTAASASTSAFNAAVPMKFGNGGSYAVMLLGAVAGAALVAF